MVANYSFQNKALYTIQLIIISTISSFIIMSCDGCKGPKVETLTEGMTVDSTDKIESITHTPSPVIQYPFTDRIFTTMNDSTLIVDGVQFVQTEYGQKITFPNGKVISSEHYPIMRDLPKKYNKNPGEYYGFYDFSKINDIKKEALLSKMDGYDPNKLKNYTEAMFTFQQYNIYDDEYNKTKLERVFVVTDLVIFEEIKRSEDDIRQFAIGRIGYMEIYDKQGNLLNEVRLDKYGCEQLYVTPNKKHIIINSNGRDENDEITMLNNGAITIWNYDNGQLLDFILHNPKFFTRGNNFSDYFYYFSGDSEKGDTVMVLNIIPNEKKVRAVFLNLNEYFHAKGRFDLGYKKSLFKDRIKTYTFQEWNRQIISERNKFKNAQE